ncbi:hypothetical protein CBL_10770, partial [Carabus blaptoides fortunei]
VGQFVRPTISRVRGLYGLSTICIRDDGKHGMDHLQTAVDAAGPLLVPVLMYYSRLVVVLIFVAHTCLCKTASAFVSEKIPYKHVISVPRFGNSIRRSSGRNLSSNTTTHHQKHT